MTDLKTHEPLLMTVNRESISIGLHVCLRQILRFPGPVTHYPTMTAVNYGQCVAAINANWPIAMTDGRMNAWTDIDDSSKRVALLKAMHTILYNRAYMWRVLHCIPCS